MNKVDQHIGSLCYDCLGTGIGGPRSSIRRGSLADQTLVHAAVAKYDCKLPSVAERRDALRLVEARRSIFKVTRDSISYITKAQD